MLRDLNLRRLPASLGVVFSLFFLLAACLVADDRDTALLGDEDDRDGSGVGGTGIRGVVTDFGSVIVNGLEVDFDADTPIYLDGERVTSDALLRGQVVAIEAIGDVDNLSARSIDIRREVLGPIEQIDQANTSLTILGQHIVLPKDVWREQALRLDQIVAVSGHRLPNGIIVATRLDAADADDSLHLYGDYHLRNDGTASVEVSGLAIEGAVASSSLSGREVFVRGRLTQGSFAAAEFEPEPDMPFGGRLARLSIAGFVDRDKQTLSKLRLSEQPDNLLRVTLPQGPVGYFGVFEGRMNNRHSVFDVDRRAEHPDIFKGMTERERYEERQKPRKPRSKRRQERNDKPRAERNRRDR